MLSTWQPRHGSGQANVVSGCLVTHRRWLQTYSCLCFRGSAGQTLASLISICAEPYTKYQPKKNIQKQWIRNLEQLRNCKTLKTTKTAANGQLCRLEIDFDLQCELPLLAFSAASARGELRLQFHLQKEQPWASAVQVLGKLIFPKTRQLDSVQTQKDVINYACVQQKKGTSPTQTSQTLLDVHSLRGKHFQGL